MYSLAQAKRLANIYAEDTGEEWAIFKTPENAMCNQPGFNTYNSGRYALCRASERAEYEAGGAKFVGAE
jgi:hypothetical protein